MSLTQVFDGQTTTGASAAFQVSELKSGIRDDFSYIGYIVDGITTGTVQIQYAPTASGPWKTPTDGEFTADFFKISPVPIHWYTRLNVTVATSVDIDAWIG